MPGKVEGAASSDGNGPLALRRLLKETGVERVLDLQSSPATVIACTGSEVIGRFRMDRKLRRRVLKGEEVEMTPRTLDFLMAAGFQEDASPILVRKKKDGTGTLKVGIVVGGRWRMKSIPNGVVSECLRLFSDLYGAEILLTGGSEDEDIVKKAAENTGRENIQTYCGEGGVKGLIETIEGLDLLISPDSGPAHLAGALGVPVLVVFTSTSPSLGFWKNGKHCHTAGQLSCRPCHKHGGNSCPLGTEECRRSLLPLEIVRRGMELIQ